MPNYYVPRLNVTISKEQAQQLIKIIPRGDRRVIFSNFVDDLVDLMEQNSERKTYIIAALKARDIGVGYSRFDK